MRHLVLTFVLAATACTTYTPLSQVVIQGEPEKPFVPQVEVKDDPFQASAEFLTPIVQTSGEWLRTYAPTYYLLRSWVDRKTGEATHQVYVSDHISRDWKFWNRANDDQAKPVEFVEIAHDVGSCGAYSGCSMTETFGLMLPDSTVRARAQANGLAVKIYAKTGHELVLNIPTAVLALQLAAIDDWKAAHPTVKEP